MDRSESSARRPTLVGHGDVCYHRRSKVKTTRLGALSAALLVGSALAGGLLGDKVLAGGTRLGDHLRLYTAIISAVEDNYVDEVKSDKLVSSSIREMLRTLDPHSNFLETKEYGQLQERQRGSYYGLGITVQAVDGNITVVAPFEGTPAHRLGIRAGDVISRIEDEDATVLRPKLIEAFNDIREYGVSIDKLIDIHEQVLPLVDQISAILVQAGAEHVQDPGHALAGPVLVKAVLPQVGKARQDRLGDRAVGAADRLAARLKLHRNTHRQPGTARPKPLLLRHCCSPFPIRVHERFTKALRVESAPVRRAMLRVRRRPGRPRHRAGRYPSAAARAPGIELVPGRPRR